jgi:hypothetical protein
VQIGRTAKPLYKKAQKSAVGEANLLSYQQFATAKRAGN